MDRTESHIACCSLDGIHDDYAADGSVKGGDAYEKGYVRDMLLQEPVPGEKQDVPVQYI